MQNIVKMVDKVDADDYDGILPCYGREGGFYPQVTLFISPCPQVNSFYISLPTG